MKKIYISSLIILGLIIAFGTDKASAQIKIGTNGATIAPSSLLELESANQGLLLPRMADTVAINALAPPNGMLIYLTKAPAVGLYVRKVTGWEYLTGSLGGNGNFNSLTVAGTVTAGSFSGPLNGNATSANTAINATNSANSTVVNDLATPQPVYPTFVLTTNGNSQLRTATTKLSFVPNTGILTATGFVGPLTGDVTGNATSATNATNASNTDILNEIASPIIHYPTFVAGTSGNLPHLVSNPGLNFVPSTGTLTATRFFGPLTGNASSATTAINATNSVNSAITDDIVTPTDVYPVFVNGSLGNQPLHVGSTRLRYQPSTGRLTAGSLVGPLTGNVTGNATSADDAQNTVNIRVTPSNLNTPFYPTFVGGTAGPLPPFTSTGLSYIPQTGALTASTFIGALQGNASSATNVTGVVAAVNGGTGQVLYSPGDMLYAGTSTSLDRLGIGAPGTILRVSAGNIPSWSTAGAGTVINVSGAANRISVIDPTVSPIVDIHANYSGQTSITTLGNVIAGTWNGTTIDVTRGGTGQPTLPINRVLLGNGTTGITTVADAAAGLVLTSNGLGIAPTYQAPGVGDMVRAVDQIVTAPKRFDDGTLVIRGTGTGETTLRVDPNSVGVATFPAGSYTLVGATGAQTISGKTFSTGTIFQGTTILDIINNTSQVTTGNITAGSFTGPLTGNVTGNVSGSAATFTGNLAGDVTGPQGTTLVTRVGGQLAADVASGAVIANTATSTRTNSTVVSRDVNGDFEADRITAFDGFIGNVTGTATNVTAIVAVANGGTGASNKTAGFNALSPITAQGEIIYGNAVGSSIPLPPSTTNTFLRGGLNPSWSTINLGAATAEVTGILPAINGGAGSINGILKANGSGLVSAAVGGTDFENPLTFSTGLTRTVNSVTVNTTQNISRLSNLTTNGLVTTSGANGTLSITTATGTGDVVLANNPVLGNLSATQVQTDKLIGNTTTPPSITAGPAAGAGPTVGLTGSNVAGLITITTGTATVGNQILATITYSGAPFGDSFPVLYPANGNAAALNATTQVFTDGTATVFTINAGSVALATTTTYIWNYHVAGN